MAFFDQKDGLTPLEKRIFLTLRKIVFFRAKKVFFPLQSLKALFLGLV